MKIEPANLALARQLAIFRLGKTRSIAAGRFLSGSRLNEHAGKHHGSTPFFIADGKNFFGLVRSHVD